MAVPQPSASSLAFRSTLARLVSPLRRVQPRVPFYELSAHRRPTLALYRNLLKQAPDENIRFRVWTLFRKNQHLTGTERTRKELLRGYKWLEIFTKANGGDSRYQAVLRRYSRFVSAKKEKEHWKHLARNEIAWIHKLRSRPIVTGSYMRPTLYNPPLPRLKPQPVNISGMIRGRFKARSNRFLRLEQLRAVNEDLWLESQFEENLLRSLGPTHAFEPVYSGDAGYEWFQPISETQAALRTLLNRDVARSEMPYPPELLELTARARREKCVNKARERQRELRGEVLSITLKRRRKGPPAHVLAKMTPEERRMDKIVRSGVSEVGYVGMTKRRMGWKLRDGGTGLAREDGLGLGKEQKTRLKRLTSLVRRQMYQRLSRSRG